MNKWMIALLMIFISSGAVKDSYARSEKKDIGGETSRITLDEAIQKAIEISPVSRIGDSIEGISKGERQQAALVPNPELSFEAGNIGGKGNYKGTDVAETTIAVSHIIETGGKRSARIKLADEEVALAGYEAEAARLDLIHDVTVAYIEAVAAEEQVTVAEEQKKLALDTFETVTKRVAAAADPVFQKNKAEVALSAAGIAVKQAQQQAKITRKRLVGFWQGTAADMKLDHGFFRKIESPREYEVLMAALRNNPDYQRWNALHERSRMALDLEKSNAIPDPRINVGIRDFRESGDQAFVVGISIPFPVFNRNQGNISKAGYETVKTDAERQKVWFALESSLNTLVDELESSFSEAQMIAGNTLPAAQKSFAEARRGHSAGKFAYLEVLDAQRTLSDVRESYNNALKKYHLTEAAINRLTSKEDRNE